MSKWRLWKNKKCQRHYASGIFTEKTNTEQLTTIAIRGSDVRTMVELTGVEPVSEKKAVRVSPGAVHLLKFPQCERVHTLDTLVAS